MNQSQSVTNSYDNGVNMYRRHVIQIVNLWTIMEHKYVTITMVIFKSSWTNEIFNISSFNVDIHTEYIKYHHIIYPVPIPCGLLLVFLLFLYGLSSLLLKLRHTSSPTVDLLTHNFIILSILRVLQISQLHDINLVYTLFASLLQIKLYIDIIPFILAPVSMAYAIF